MAVDEASRLHLYEQARTAFGAAAADTLMTALPREPDRIATRDDVLALGTELRSEMSNLGTELRSEISERNSELLRTMFFGMLASNATLVGLVFAAARLA